jgi:hypothetical protein
MVKKHNVYLFRSIRFYNEKVLNGFQDLCTKNDCSVTHGINAVLADAVKNQKLPDFEGERQ